MFRELTRTDVAALAALDAVLPDGELRRDAEEFSSFINQPAAVVYGWEEGGQLLAYVLFVCAGDTADLCHIVTLPATRGRGVGRKLLGAALKALSDKSVGDIFLEVQVGNTPAEALYARFGAEQVGLRPAYYALPDGGRADARVLRLQARA